MLYGQSEDEEDRDYETRIEEVFDRFEEQAERYDKEKPSKLVDYVNELVSDVSSIYAEIGLQAGFLIMMDIMKNIEGYKGAEREDTPNADYRKMYEYLLGEVSIALKSLQENNKKSIETAIIILKAAQCKTEEIYIVSEH